MKTRAEAMAAIKAIQDKLQGNSGAAASADGEKAMLADLLKAVALLGAAEPSRRMKFGGHGDSAHQRAGAFASLPKDVQKELDGCVIAATMLKKDVRSLGIFKRLMDESSEFKKAMDSATADEGGDWVPTGLSPELVGEVTQMGMIEQMHPHISMPTQPYELPLQIGRLTPYLATQQTANSGQTNVTKSSAAGTVDKLTLTAIDLAVEVLTSKHLEEDSIVPILPFLRSEIVKTLARGVENAGINGDTTATHQDTDTHAIGATDHRRAWLGYRKLALANGYSLDMANGGNAFDFETFMKVRAKHGKYGINPADLFWILSLQGYFKALSLKDAAGNPVVTTIDKLGSRATAITGVLGVLAGSEIAVSEFQRDDINASGVNGAVSADNIKTSILSVQKSGFVFGDRRDARIQLLGEIYAEAQQDALLSVIRKAFAPLRPIASNAAVAIGYNVALV